ncbi:MAG: hypothetical protein IJ594_02985 [Oscillospiraceae bacterium]|nr:hypothetical protein [Oscillospiraceae bacterium]
MNGARWKMALLMCLTAAALFMGAEAYRSLRPVEQSELPEELYARYLAQADTAEHYLKGSGAYVAVYADAHGREPVTVTGIELDGLRSADRAMVEEGIPVADRKELLLLLEDLGS